MFSPGRLTLFRLRCDMGNLASETVRRVTASFTPFLDDFNTDFGVFVC